MAGISPGKGGRRQRLSASAALEPNAPTAVKAQAVLAFKFTAEHLTAEHARANQQIERARQLDTKAFNATVKVTHAGDLAVTANIEVEGHVIDELIIRLDRKQVTAFGPVRRLIDANPNLVTKLRQASKGDSYQTSTPPKVDSALSTHPKSPKSPG